MCSCPRQSASGCCAQPLPRFGPFSLFPSLVFLLCCLLITMSGGKVASRESCLLVSFSLPASSSWYSSATVWTECLHRPAADWTHRFCFRLQIFSFSLRHGDGVIPPVLTQASGKTLILHPQNVHSNNKPASFINV